MATLYAGTSGFSYQAWKPAFYPADVPAARFLEHYAARLNCVEVNYSFRRMPSPALLTSWAERTPPGFSFAMKAHQRITHSLRLKDAGDPTAYFLKTLEPLRVAGRLGPVLFQLPPTLKADPGRLAAYLELLPAGLRATFEFREPSWFSDEVFELLRSHGMALCVAQSETLSTPDVVTADFAYYRLRRPGYTRDELAAVARRSRELTAAGRDVYLVFKHEESPQSALDAEQLLHGAQETLAA